MPDLPIKEVEGSTVTGNVQPGTGSRTTRWVGHVAATAAVLVATGIPAGPPAGQFEWSSRALAFSAVTALVLLARHRAPFVVLGVILGLVCLSVPLGVYSSGMVLAAAIATFTVNLRVTRRVGVAISATGAVVMVVCSALTGELAPQHALAVLLGAAIGDALRSQRAVVAAATERAERAERTREALARQRVAEDRLAIARDLHDVVAHQIAVINLHAGVASGALRARPDDAERSLALIRSSSRTVLAEIGDLLATLRDPDSVEIGPTGLAQLDDLVRDLAVHGLQVTVRVEGGVRELPARTDVTALRVIQEALTNAHKHGTEGRAHVLLHYGPGTLRITVTNPMTPAPQLTEVPGTHQGLVGMAERVAAARGTLTYGATGTGMWQLDAELPVGPRADAPESPAPEATPHDRSRP